MIGGFSLDNKYLISDPSKIDFLKKVLNSFLSDAKQQGWESGSIIDFFSLKVRDDVDDLNDLSAGISFTFTNSLKELKINSYDASYVLTEENGSIYLQGGPTYKGDSYEEFVKLIRKFL